MSDTMSKVDRALTTFFDTFWRREPWFAEFWSGFDLLFLAFVVLRIPHEWQAMSRLEYVLSSEGLQLIAFVLGSFQLLALTFDDRATRWFASCICAGFWGVVTASVWQSMSGFSPACVMGLGYVGMNVFSGVRLTRPKG